MIASLHYSIPPQRTKIQKYKTWASAPVLLQKLLRLQHLSALGGTLPCRVATTMVDVPAIGDRPRIFMPDAILLSLMDPFVEKGKNEGYHHAKVLLDKRFNSPANLDETCTDAHIKSHTYQSSSSSSSLIHPCSNPSTISSRSFMSASLSSTPTRNATTSLTPLTLPITAELETRRVWIAVWVLPCTVVAGVTGKIEGKLSTTGNAKGLVMLCPREKGISTGHKQRRTVGDSRRAISAVVSDAVDKIPQPQTSLPCGCINNNNVISPRLPHLLMRGSCRSPVCSDRTGSSGSSLSKPLATFAWAKTWSSFLSRHDLVSCCPHEQLILAAFWIASNFGGLGT